MDIPNIIRSIPVDDTSLYLPGSVVWVREDDGDVVLAFPTDARPEGWRMGMVVGRDTDKRVSVIIHGSITLQPPAPR